MDNEMVNLSLADVYRTIWKGVSIENSSITGMVEIWKVAKEQEVNKNITFVNCYLEALDASDITYQNKLTLANCVIGAASLSTSYFLSGLTIDGCEFISDIFLISEGGHNAKDKPIIIKDTIFRGYVDMNDAWFEGPVEISNCQFIKGSNLLGNKGQPFEVIFDVEPVIANNNGRLDLDGDMFDWRKVPWTQAADGSKYRTMEPIPGYDITNRGGTNG